VTQNKPTGIIALVTQTQQILLQVQRQIQFAAVRMMSRLSPEKVNEFRGGTQLLPQPQRKGVDTARFRRRLTFHREQGRSQGTVEFELL
jgi:adenine C2-methylase RlmN of 23S rRNA A2503 and tRNA A37